MITMKNIPSGTITFLFSDIEGSTQRWEKDRESMRSAFNRQEEIMRAAMEKHGGYVYKMIGDAFQAAFSSAPAALAAAWEAQRGLQDEAWEGSVPIKVRIALHTGETEERGDDYVGPLLNRVARLMAAAHGGQVLLTRTTSELVQENLPPGTWLIDLGKHRLKDLERPEHVYQLGASGLQVDFPALNTLDAQPNNLPVQQTSFIGRDDELKEVLDLISETRLLTLTGPGGVGKTRLALQAAAQSIDSFPDGTFFVPLAAVISPDFIPQSIAEAMKFNFDNHSSTRSSEEQLLEYLEPRSLLLVLDNFEHLMGGTEFIMKLLESTSQLNLLVTSRERLKLKGEWTYEVKGMGFPTNGSTAGLEEYSAVQLFVERARQVHSYSTLTDDEKPCVKRICQLVEGMPLGIELAAGWLPVLSCQEIAEEIETSLDFLSSTQRDQPDKHRSLRAAFEYSWKLLDEEHKRVFRGLSVFKGGFGRKAAAQILGADLMTLSDLVDKSFLHRTDQGRYEIHELLRQFGNERLNSHPDEKKQTSENHSRYYVEFLQSVQKEILGENLIQIREQVRIDKGNIRAALQWGVIHWQAPELAAALYAYMVFFFVQGWHEGREAFQDLILYIQTNRSVDQAYYTARAYYALFAASITHLDEAGNVCREDLPVLRELDLGSELGICLLNSGIIACERGEYELANEQLSESIHLLKESNRVSMAAEALLWLGYVIYLQGDYAEAKSHFEESYQTYQNVRDLVGTSFALSKLGLIADALQDYPSARRYHGQGLEIFKRFGDKAGVGYTNSRLSLTAYGERNYAEAIEYGRIGLESFSEIGHLWGIGASNCRIGFAALELGELELAEVCFQEALDRAQETQQTPLILYALAGIGNLLAMQGNSERGVELISFVQEHPMTPSIYRELAERHLTEFEEKMGSESFNAAQVHGREVDLEQVLLNLDLSKVAV
jgi:predicted ATPase/class 3 adenylate cyclase